MNIYQLGGLGLAISGVALYFNGFNVVQSGGLLILGLGLFITNTTFPKKKKTVAKEKASDKKVEVKQIQLDDFDCINHLTERCIKEGRDDGVKMCKELSNIFFDIQHKLYT